MARLPACTQVTAGATVRTVRIQIHATGAALRVIGRARGAASIVGAGCNRMCPGRGTFGGRATRGRCDADACAAAGAGSLTRRTRPIASRILCDARAIAVLRQIGRATLNARSPIATHGTARGCLAGGDTFSQAAGCRSIVADACTAAVVIVRIAANRTGTGLTNRGAVRIRRALDALTAAGGCIVVGRAGTAALVMSSTAGKRTSPARRAPVARCSRGRGARSTLGAAGIGAGVRRANAGAVVRARGTLGSAGCRRIDACAVAEFLGSWAGAAAKTG